MERVRYEKPYYIGNYKVPRPCSVDDIPSPATSTSSEADGRSSATFSGGYRVIENGHEVASYARSPSPQSSKSRNTCNVSSNVNRSSKRQFSSNMQGSQVAIDRKVLRALLIYVRETRIRLQETELKLETMEAEMGRFREKHDQQMITLARCFLTIQNQISSRLYDGTSADDVHSTQPRHQSSGKITGNEKDDNNAVLMNTVDERKSGESFEDNTTNVVDNEKDNKEPEMDELPVFGTKLFDLDTVEPKTVDRNPEFYIVEDDREEIAAGRNGKPIYSIVKKKKKRTPNGNKSAEFESPSGDVSSKQTPTTETHHDAIANQESNFSSSPAHCAQTTTGSPCDFPELFVKSALGDKSLGTNSDANNPPVIRIENRDKINFYTKTAPFPESDSVDSAQSKEMATRCSGDGFYITNSFARKQECVRNGDLAAPSREQELDSSSQSRNKASVLLGKFKRKLKQSARKLSRTTSSDSIVSDSPSVSEPSADTRLDIAITTGDVKVISAEDYGNNNIFRLADGLALHQQKSYISYKAALNDRETVRTKLDSTGDVDSRRSTDASDIPLNDNSVHSAGYETITIRPLDNQLKAHNRAPLSPNNPNQLSNVTVNPAQRKFSSSDITTSHTRDSVSSTNEDDSVVLPQTVFNELYSSIDRQLSAKKKQFIFCEVADTGVQPCVTMQTCVSNAEEDIFAELDELHRYILDEATQQQAEIEKLEHGVMPGEPPPKPSRPGFPASRGYPPQSSDGLYAPTAMQPGMYPIPGGRAPGIPPKNPVNIMTPEELVQHEARTNLKRRQLDEAEIQRRIEMQQQEALENDQWIKAQELNPEVPTSSAVPEDDPDQRYASVDDVRKTAPPKPSRKPPNKDPVATEPPKLKFEEVKPTPTMKLDREGDNVYRDTMSVVKSVLQSNHQVMDAQPDDIFGFVRNIGKALKELCTSLDQEMPNLPEQFHREIDMAQKTTNKDLSQIINQMKLVKKFYVTTQVHDYKRCLMAANQVLAMDAKNLLDVVDKARFYKLERERSSAPRTIDTPSPPPEAEEAPTTSTSTPPPLEQR